MRGAIAIGDRFNRTHISFHADSRVDRQVDVIQVIHLERFLHLNWMACQEFRKEVDAVFPEHMSRLHRSTIEPSVQSYRRHQRRVLHRETTAAGVVGRYRTQPVTFDEIKVVHALFIYFLFLLFVLEFLSCLRIQRGHFLIF